LLPNFLSISFHVSLLRATHLFDRKKEGNEIH
jgi:hypothetical protein